MSINYICGYHHCTSISQFTSSVPSCKLCTWNSSFSKQYLRSTLNDDGVLCTLHICMVPYKVYRWGGLQWHDVYMDFHKHWFIDVCHVSVLCKYTAVCLQPDLMLEMISVWCGNLWGLLWWIRGVICFIIFVIFAFLFFYECQYASY
jgi:hypothetical protein